MKELIIAKRKLPHWTLDDSLYFISFKTRTTKLSLMERQLVYEYICEGNDFKYQIHAAVVMHNHVHLLITLLNGNLLSTVMKSIKGVTARRINQNRKTSGSIWQSESYDHIIRNEAELSNVLDYIAANPYRAGLVDDNENYPYLYFRTHPLS